MNNYERNLGVLDALNIVSFLIGYLNYEENLTQTDKQELISVLNKKSNLMLDEIHKHLEKQDRNINKIMEVLGIETDKETN